MTSPDTAPHEKAPNRADTVASVEQAWVRYGDITAVADASLTVGRGEVHVLLGPSGCGKTTLLRAIAGLERLHGGVVRLSGRVVEDASSSHTWAPPEARRVGLVFQDYALFPHLTIAENVSFSRQASKAQVANYLARVGLHDLAHRFPSELSGGQQQRVALARALASEPEVLLMDEPFSGVDQRLRRSLRKDMVSLLREAGTGVLFVTHDVEEAFALGDTLSVMSEGRILQTGTPQSIYSTPADVTVALTVGDATLVPATRAPQAAVATCALGTVPIRTAPGEASHRMEGHLVVRPEQVRLSSGSTESSAANGVPVTLLERTFLGGSIESTARLGDGTTITARQLAGRQSMEDDVSARWLAWVEGAAAWI
jgi:iron(III) transport system ATP-binding protein